MFVHEPRRIQPGIGTTVRAQNEISLMAADGRLSARIAARYSLVQWQEAFAHAGRTGSARDGKIIMRPNG